MDTTKADSEAPVDSKTLSDDSRTVADSGTAAPKLPRWPANIRDHEMIRRIGQGSYGEVWLARNVMGTYRAVKIVYRASFEHERPFEREFHGIQKFEPLSRSHEGFVDILHVGSAQDHFYYVMELGDDVNAGQQIDPNRYEPKTLRGEVQGQRRLPFDRCVEIGLSLAQALGKLHEHGLIHRDIKPSNIIFVDGVPKLADIGLVAEQSEAKSFVGTEGFIPPEGPGTPQADIYSLGKVLYEMATGKDRHEFPALPTLLGDTESDTHLLELNTVFLKACQSDLKKRYQTCEQMRDELLLLQGGKSVKRARETERRLSLLYKFSAAGIMLTLLALGGFWYASLQATRAREQAALETRLRSQADQRDRESRQNLYAAQMLLAGMALADKNFGQVRELLEKQRPRATSGGDAYSSDDLRGWEWRYLWNQVRSDEEFTLGRQAGGLSSISFGPDGRTLASGSWDGPVNIWDIGQRRVTASLPHPKCARSVAYSPDGAWLATGCEDGVVRLWDPTTHSLRYSITNDIEVQSLVFSPDSALLAGDSTAWVKLWAVNTRATFAHFPGTNFHLFTGMAFSPDGRSFAYPESEAVIRLWNLAAKSPSMTLTGEVQTIQTLQFTHSGKQLIAGGQNRLVQVWDLETRSVLTNLTNFASWIGYSEISPDGKTLAVSSSDQTVKLFDTSTWEQLGLLKGHADEVWAVAYSPDGRTLATGSKDRTIKIWSATPPSARPTFKPFSPDLRFFSLSPAGETLLLIYADNTFQLCDTATVREGERKRLPTPVENLSWSRIDVGHLARIALGPQGELIAFAGEHGRLVLWNTTTQREVEVFGADSETAQLMAFSFDGKTLAVGKTNQVIELWDTATRKQLASLAAGGVGLQSLAFSKDGNFLASSRGNQAEVWSVSERRRIAWLRGHEADVNDIAVSPDARLAATVSWDSKAKIWDISSQRELMSFGGAFSGFVGVTISPDGSRVAASSENRIKLIDVEKKLEVGSLKGGTGLVAFLPDGNTLFAVSAEGFQVWRAASFAETDGSETTRPITTR